MSSIEGQIGQVREASRRMVRELGFMRDTIAATNLPPSAVHALIEIAAGNGITAKRLGEILLLEKSSVSRMVRKLVTGGKISERADPQDARAKLLELTPEGLDAVKAIDAFGHRQVASAFAHLSEADRELVVAGLSKYAEALRAERLAR